MTLVTAATSKSSRPCATCREVEVMEFQDAYSRKNGVWSGGEILVLWMLLHLRIRKSLGQRNELLNNSHFHYGSTETWSDRSSTSTRPVSDLRMGQRKLEIILQSFTIAIPRLIITKHRISSIDDRMIERNGDALSALEASRMTCFAAWLDVFLFQISRNQWPDCGVIRIQADREGLLEVGDSGIWPGNCLPLLGIRSDNVI
jgi:hypothetical protein